MRINKANWITDGDRVNIHMPLTKVDVEHRRVSGFATLDNVDQHGDVVTMEGSRRAFAAFRGNIREMHESIAVGKLVDFREEEYIKDGEVYSGIYVTAYVSKGAESTWQKVLDGTLSGFSIGGSIHKSITQLVKDATGEEKSVRFIEDYSLNELSLVDSPANQLANVLSIQKVDNGTVATGMVAETEVLNVFWCEKDEIAKHSDSPREECFNCGNEMKSIAWIEKQEGVSAKVGEIVARFLRSSSDVQKNETYSDEGGVEMSDNSNAQADEATGTTVEEGTHEEVTRNDVSDGTQEGTVEESEVEEVETEESAVEEVPEEPDFEKMFHELKSAVSDAVTKSNEKVAEVKQEVESRVSEVTKAFEEKTERFEKGLEEIKGSLDEIKKSREEVEKRLGQLESFTSMKKSGDVETDFQKSASGEKGFWSSTFFGEGD